MYVCDRDLFRHKYYEDINPVLCHDPLTYITNGKNISLRFSINSDVFLPEFPKKFWELSSSSETEASELLENRKKCFAHSVFSMSKSSST